MVTPKFKDRVLSILCSGTFAFERYYTVNKQSLLQELSDKFSDSCSENELTSILAQFRRLGLISDFSNNSLTVNFIVLLEANDFYSHGGFLAQEELLKANIEKLGYELDYLSKELAPEHLETANKLAGIGSAILSALSLFKS